MSITQVITDVAAHLAKQRGQSVNEDGDCQYNAEDGSHCAIGSLIPSRLYHESLEGESAGTLFLALMRDQPNMSEATAKKVEVAQYLQTLVPELQVEQALEQLHAIQEYHDATLDGPLPTYVQTLIDFTDKSQEELQTEITLQLTTVVAKAVAKAAAKAAS